jgi:uncharacterized membrane-anchored protein
MTGNEPSESTDPAPALGKVPAVTLGFWLVKIAATTLGETAGDALTMSLDLGYLAGTLIFAAILLCALALQIRARRFHPMLFWAVIVATTTVGTTLADFCDRSLGIGYLGGTALLSALLAASLLAWHRTLGSVSVERLDSRTAEIFYWLTILFSQTLGTALGDWVADPLTGWGLGYEGGAMLFAAGLGLVIAAWLWSRVSNTVLFWAAFILTRPLGATIGDFLDKPVANGGLALDRFSASAALAGCMLLMILALPQRPERIRPRA